jgi:hypothetical protein
MEARNLCRANGGDLATSAQLCPKPHAPLGGALAVSGDGGWVPVGNNEALINGEYAYIGKPVDDYSGRGHTLQTCALHHQVPGNEHCCRGGVGLPTWAYDHSGDQNKAKLVACRTCTVTNVDAPLCPKPTCARPNKGCTYVPSAEKDDKGCPLYACGMLRCHTEAPPGQVCWTKRYITVGTKTWSESNGICRTHGETLVTAKELCPHGYQSSPAVGIITRSGLATQTDQSNGWKHGPKAWVPVAGEDQFDYIYMGPDRADAEGDGRTLKACTKYSQFPAYSGVTPKWAEDHSADLQKGDVVYCRACSITSFGSQ